MRRQTFALCALALVPVALTAQAGQAGRQGGQGRQGGPPATARSAAPVDLTGQWVSVVTEDWRYRMITAPKGDHPGLPLNAEGNRVANAWDPARDEAAGEQCKAYGAAGVMRAPGRLHVTWESDDSLKLETEAGTQTRLFTFGAVATAAGAPTWQGTSMAQWEVAGGGGRRGRGGMPVGDGSARAVAAARGANPMGSKVRPGLVFVQDAKGNFAPRLVRLGVRNYDFSEVVSGLQEGEKVAMLAAAQLQALRQQRNEQFKQMSGGGRPGSQKLGAAPAGGGAGGGQGGGGRPRP